MARASLNTPIPRRKNCSGFRAGNWSALPAHGLFGADASLQARFPDAIGGKFGTLRQDARSDRSGVAVPVSLAIVPLHKQAWAALLEVRVIEHHILIERHQQLSNELAAQRESLRNLAHEVKNPLGGIRGAAQLLEAELDRTRCMNIRRSLFRSGPVGRPGRPIDSAAGRDPAQGAIQYSRDLRTRLYLGACRIRANRCAARLRCVGAGAAGRFFQAVAGFSEYGPQCRPGPDRGGALPPRRDLRCAPVSAASCCWPPTRQNWQSWCR